MADTQAAGLAAAAEQGKVAKPRNKPSLLLILIALSSMGSLAVSSMALLSRSRGVPAAAQPAKQQAEQPVERHDLGEFLVNLSDPDGQAFVKATIVVECEATEEKGKSGGEGEGGDKETKEWEPPVRDAIIGVISQCDRETLRAENGKERLKKQILTRINSGELRQVPKFTAVYFTSFAMQ
ncbi:MAG TPA: flagellar basal body-associated FliL family protein [Armatimonadota bacterium]|nr:flagellar basal body-associated FliL family protein [Armatimonadota bacterium]